MTLFLTFRCQRDTRRLKLVEIIELKAKYFKRKPRACFIKHDANDIQPEDESCVHVLSVEDQTRGSKLWVSF